MSAAIVFLATDADADQRLDVFVQQKLAESEREMTRTFVQKAIEGGFVAVNGTARAKNYKLKHGDRVEYTGMPRETLSAEPQDIPLDIVYEDDALIVVNKSKGLVVHPAPGNASGTLVNALMYHCAGSLSGINGVERPGIVHRLDKDTSGLLVAAKTDKAHASLAKQLADHTMTREYTAVAHGVFDALQGEVDAPLARDKKDRIKYTVDYGPNAKRAVTRYEMLAQFHKFAHISLKLLTGRTHQIRVHMAHIRHPLAGDRVYGYANTPELGGQCLHAGVLGFIHPESGEYMQFNSDPPAVFLDFLEQLSRE